MAKIDMATIDPVKNPIACIENVQADIRPRFLEEANSEIIIAWYWIKIRYKKYGNFS